MIKTLYILQHVEILSLEVVIISECGWMERAEECRALVVYCVRGLCTMVGCCHAGLVMKLSCELSKSNSSVKT